MAAAHRLDVTVEAEADKVRCIAESGGDIEEEWCFGADGIVADLEDRVRHKQGWRHISCFDAGCEHVCPKTDRLDKHERLTVRRDFSELISFLRDDSVEHVPSRPRWEAPDALERIIETSDFGSITSLLIIGPGVILPEDIDVLNHLNELVITGINDTFELPTLPSSINGNKALKTLRMSGIFDPKDWDLSNLSALELADFMNCAFKALPPSICGLKTLKTLVVTSCLNLEALPDDLGRLKALEKLHVKPCGLRRRFSVPESVSSLPLLKDKVFVYYRGESTDESVSSGESSEGESED